MTNPMVEAAQAMRALGISQEEIDEYIISLSEGTGIPVTTMKTLNTFNVNETNKDIEEPIRLGSSMASSLDMPIPANDLLKELKTREALDQAIEAKKRGISEFDLVKSERKV